MSTLRAIMGSPLAFVRLVDRPTDSRVVKRESNYWESHLRCGFDLHLGHSICRSNDMNL